MTVRPATEFMRTWHPRKPVTRAQLEALVALPPVPRTRGVAQRRAALATCFRSGFAAYDPPAGDMFFCAHPLTQILQPAFGSRFINQEWRWSNLLELTGWQLKRNDLPTDWLDPSVPIQQVPTAAIQTAIDFIAAQWSVYPIPAGLRDANIAAALYNLSTNL